MATYFDKQWREHQVVEATEPAPGHAAIYLTFGTMYAREPHPSGLDWVHPDGFLTVTFSVTEAGYGPCRERARMTVWQYLSGHYAFDYNEPPTEWCPRGELALLVLP